MKIEIINKVILQFPKNQSDDLGINPGTATRVTNFSSVFLGRER
jgi:hypothetical protein